jgi:hypothetical protein
MVARDQQAVAAGCQSRLITAPMHVTQVIVRVFFKGLMSDYVDALGGCSAPCWHGAGVVLARCWRSGAGVAPGVVVLVSWNTR